MTWHAKDCPALILNADFRPLSYFPLSLMSWQDAVRVTLTDRVNVISEYDRVVRSPSLELNLPSVVSLKRYIPQSRRPAFTRFNVFLRDRFACQYCSTALPVQELTFDHVVPRSQGGRTTWRNVVSACSICNLQKGGRTPSQSGMVPKRAPRPPSLAALQQNGRMFPPNFLHDSWRDFLYWDSELDPL